MKRTIYLSFFFILSSFFLIDLYAQVDPANDVAGSGSVAAYHVSPPSSYRSTDPIYIKVYFHLINKEDGSEVFPISRLDYTKSRMDAEFNPHNIFFDYDCDVSIIADDYLHGLQGFDKAHVQCAWRNEATYKKPDGLNIYIIGQDAPNAGSAGLAGGILSNWLVVLGGHSKSDPGLQMEQSTLPHEIGHCFGLFHLHYGCTKNGLVHNPPFDATISLAKL